MVGLIVIKAPTMESFNLDERINHGPHNGVLNLTVSFNNGLEVR